MNDFYDPRRTLLADVGGLVGMAAAGVAASSLVWETLARGFKTGELEWAFFLFLAVVLGASAVGGLLGLAGGRALGGVWEERHRRRRSPPTEEILSVSRAPNVSASSVPSTPTSYPAEPGITSVGSRQASRVIAKEYAGPPGIRVCDMLSDTGLLNALLQRTGLDQHHLTSPEHFHGTGAIGAWNGNALIGAARVVSHGDVTLLMDVVVDPGYRRRGIGRALVVAATSASPGPVWNLGASSGESVAFLTALGAQRTSDAWRLG